MVDEPFIKALKEDYMRYGGRMPYEMIAHLWTKISKVINKDKVQLKKEVFIKWEQPQVLSAYFIQIKKQEKNLQNGTSKYQMMIP